MTNVFKAIGVILVIAFALSKCNSESRQARSEFVAGCTQNGLSDTVCKCAADKMTGHYGEKSIVDMQRNQRVPRDLPDFMMQATVQCARP